MDIRRYLQTIMQRGGTGLAEELGRHLDEWSRRTGISVETWALPAGRVPQRVTDAVLACLAEALSNVEKHSGASVVSVAVTVGASGLRLTISDHGRGFLGRASGRGVVAMSAHLAAVGGRCAVNGTPGGGTTVSGIVPAAALRGP
ncbi:MULTISPECIES: sensor histidine kinase [Nonomuraea]|uniref:Sensor histidine kinase n=1 Tax=Nonomuraea mangrovi TaxID=2316207 RepID=A0ABW4TD88_9ACTN